MNFKRICLFLLIVFRASFLVAQENDSLALKLFIHENNLQKTDPLFLVQVNPNECQKYKFALKLLQKKFDDAGIGDHLIYLIGGLRQKEADYYLKNELGFKNGNHRAISDDAFSKKLNPSNQGTVFLIYKLQIAAKYSIYDAAGKINFRKEAKARYFFNLVDSTILQEVQTPFSKVTRPRLLNDSEMLFLNYRYNVISCYAIRNGKFLRELKAPYDYPVLFEQIDPDTAKAHFAQRCRHLIAGLGMRELIYDNMIVHDNRIYISCTFLFPTWDGGRDTVIGNYPFLLETDADFGNPHYYYLQVEHPYKYAVQTNNNFFALGGRSFLFNLITFKDSMDKQGRNPYLTRFSWDKSKGHYVSDQTGKLVLPAYFLENHLDYKYNTNDFLVYDQTLYSYFSEILPFVFSLDGRKVFSLPDSSYLATTGADWLNKKQIDFNIIAGEELPEHEIAFVVASAGKYYLEVLDGKTKGMIWRTEIPLYVMDGGRVVLKGNRLYILNPRDLKTWLYRFDYGKRSG